MVIKQRRPKAFGFEKPTQLPHLLCRPAKKAEHSSSVEAESSRADRKRLREEGEVSGGKSQKQKLEPSLESLPASVPTEQAGEHFLRHHQ